VPDRLLSAVKAHSSVLRAAHLRFCHTYNTHLYSTCVAPPAARDTSCNTNICHYILYALLLLPSAQAQLVLAKVLLVQDNAAAAEALLRPAHTRAKCQSRSSPLVTLLEVEALWSDIQSRLADKRSTGTRRWLEAPFGVLLHSTRSSNSGGTRSWNDRTNSGSAASASGSGSGNNLVNTVGGASSRSSRASALPRFATIALASSNSGRPGMVWAGSSGSSGSSIAQQQQRHNNSRRTSWLTAGLGKWHTYRGKRSASSPHTGSALTATTAGDSAEELEILSQQLRGPHAPRGAHRRRKSDTDAIELQRHAEASMSAARCSTAALQGVGSGYHEHGPDGVCSSDNEFNYLGGEGDARSQLYPAITDSRTLVSDSGIMRFR
jgi:hypothetical protein